MNVRPGDRAPEFRAAASTGQTLETDSFSGRVPVAMLFTEGPSAAVDDLAAYSDAHNEFGEHRTQLLAVVNTTAAEARALADRHGITYPLLADADGSIARDFGADNSEAVIIDIAGRVAKVFDERPTPAELEREIAQLADSDFDMVVNR